MEDVVGVAAAEGGERVAAEGGCGELGFDFRGDFVHCGWVRLCFCAGCFVPVLKLIGFCVDFLKLKAGL